MRLENAWGGYRGGGPAHKDHTQAVPDGEMLVIVGLSGAGKSTLIRAINVLVPLESGDVILDGKSIAEATEKHKRENRYIQGLIFQTLKLVKTAARHANVK